MIDGIIKKYGIKVLGTSIEGIKITEDRAAIQKCDDKK